MSNDAGMGLRYAGNETMMAQNMSIDCSVWDWTGELGCVGGGLIEI